MSAEDALKAGLVSFDRLWRKLIDLQSWSYIARSALAWKTNELWSCPCCGSTDYEVVTRKSMVTALARCSSCQLLFRLPRDPVIEAREFYDEEYRSGGMTTTPPGGGALAQLLGTGFRGTDKNFSSKIRVLEALKVMKGARVLDFGASWGYATWQMRQSGYDASGFEISRPRAQFGRETLDLEVATREDELHGPFDAIFSSHVFEHLSNPLEGLALARRLLRKGGIFVAFTPNGSEVRLRANRGAYNHSWGRLHPIYLDERFYQHALPDVPKLLTSRNYGDWRDLTEIAAWRQDTDEIHELSRPELMIAFVNSGP